MSDIIADALRVTAGLIVAAWNNGLKWFIVFCAAVTLWLAVCFIALTMGWSRTRSRLLLGLGAAVIFAFLPYIGPWLAIGNFAQGCNEGGVGPCTIFGGHVGSPGHDAVQAVLVIIAGAPIALGAFLVYAVVALIIHTFFREHPSAPAQ